ncbi:MAG: M20/M25/M40 family metallo-hydrolase [Pyrinomonadaceae bacterium]
MLTGKSQRSTGAVVTIVAALILSSDYAAKAQQPQATPIVYPAQLTSSLKQIQRAALDSDYAYAQVAHLSNNIGPRLSGSPQGEKAVEYVAAEMKRLGLDVQLEKVTVPHWVRGEETAALVEFPGMAAGTTQKIVLTALGGSVATPANGLTAEIVVVNNFEELQTLGSKNVSGKIVLFNVVFDKQLAAQGFAGPAYGQAVAYRAAGPSAASRLGAVAALIRSVGGADYRLPHTGQTRYAADASRIPAGAVAAEDADLIAYLARQGTVKMHLLLTPQTLPDAVGYNVIADLKGSEHPEQVVIVSGHLDSWDLGTGAIDDGAGVAIAMQTAQLLKQLRLRPKRTIRVIAWASEENSLNGGRTYAANHKDDMANQYAAIESDLGAGHPVGIFVDGKPGLIPLLQPLANILRTSGAGVLSAVDDTGADISFLGAAGVPTFAPIQDSRTYFNYHHTAADTLDKIVPRELQENCAVVAALAYTLADLPQALPR